LVSRRSAISISFLVGTVAVTFRDLLTTDDFPVYRDLLVFVVPFKHFLRERLWSGELPLWNPYVYLGTPFLASLQSGVLYPPSAFLLLPFPLGLNLFLIGHYGIALIGFWWLSRVRGLSQTAAAIGALTFALGGYLVSTLSTTNHLQTCAWAPWALALWMRRVDAGGARGRVIDAGVALVLALQILAGAPEGLLLTVFLMGAWTLYRVAAQPSRLSRLTLALSGTVLLAALLTSFQIAPTVEYISQSARRGALPYGVASSWSLEPVSLLQLVLPPTAPNAGTLAPSHDFIGLETTEPWIRSIYLGIAPLCLIVAGVASGRERRFWSIMIVLFTLLALGAHTPFFRVAYDLFPWGFGKFRFPAKFFFVVHLSAAVLAAEGADVLAHDVCQSVAPPPGIGRHCGENRLRFLNMVLEQGVQQCVLVGKIFVQRADRHAGAFGDVVGGAGGVAARSENLSRGAQDHPHGFARTLLQRLFSRAERGGVAARRHVWNPSSESE
jgi:hypothetical protein